MGFERDFLKLAAVWLSCRLHVMGGIVTDDDGVTPHGTHIPVTDMHTLGWALLGCVDYAAEMQLICKEVLQ